VTADVFETAIETALTGIEPADEQVLLALTRSKVTAALCSSVVLALARRIAEAVLDPLKTAHLSASASRAATTGGVVCDAAMLVWCLVFIRCVVVCFAREC
jgi:hypothetical protein